MTTVSVVIAAYNAESYIGDALLSVRQQTLRDVEVVVVDDGSADQTLRELERFAGSLDLVVLRQANAGPAAARNAGIRRARGEYCAFLDADDVMLPERLGAQAALLDAEPDVALVHTDLMTFNEEGIIHRTRHVFSEPCGGMVIDQLVLDNFITTSTVMARKEKLLECGLFDEARRISEDFELWLRMAARWKVGFIDRPLVQYRRRPGSLSADKLVTGRSALEVIEAFWRDRSEYRTSHPRVFRKSLAHHLTTVGCAAVDQGERRAAFSHLLKSLAKAPGERRTWRCLAKAMVLPMFQQVSRSPDGHNEGIR